MDEKTLHLLEFNKVRERLAAYASFSSGEELALNLLPCQDVETAQRWQAETAEALTLLDSQRDITIGGTRDIRRPADNALRGFTLLAEDFLAIQNTLVAAGNLRQQLLKSRQSNPHLAYIATLIEDCPGLNKAISASIDERGHVLDSASTKLANTRKELSIAHGRIQEKLQRLLHSNLHSHLQESVITMRSGRYVVPVRTESKGRIKGIVHDQSGSGATLWVEPMNTVDLNNTFRGLQLQEENEIIRILAELSNQVADHAEALKRIVDRMAELDLVFARAKYASEINAIPPVFIPWRDIPAPHPPKHVHKKWEVPPPNLHPGSTIWIKGGRHPLLPPNQVVPTDWTLAEDTFLVLITGPNTGGKTVSLKTLGLMVMMAQSGLHLPAIEARLTFFEQLFADIGDEQSIEQNLSTFSAHISNIIRILKLVNDRSLILLDELGSGTDPSEGAALAQSTISFLRDKGATTFVATHYPELKLYASQTSGVMNASLLFDVDTLSPTFELSIGLPGRSNALVIARRLGLDDTVLDEAMRLLGAGATQAEAMLDSIQDLRERISAQEAASRIALRKTIAERDNLQGQLEAIEVERQQILSQAQSEAEAELEALRKEIRIIRKQLRDAGSKTAVKKISQNVQMLQEEGLDLPATPLTSQTPHSPQQKRIKRQHIEINDLVLIKSLKTRGEVVSLSKKEAVVAIGRMQMRVKFDDLELKERPKTEVETSTPSHGQRGEGASPGLELDIRGERVEEGLAALARYLDQAFLASLPWVRIVHGKGTGRLRQAVRKALSKNPYIRSWAEGEEGEGGSGVTVAKLKTD